ncbi:MAG: glycosyltransferase family 4 protein [Candidatus Helarchaeota archaeon]
MIKICFILSAYWRYNKGGSEYQTKLLIDYLKRDKKFKIYYICSGGVYKEIKINGIKLFILPNHNIFYKLGRPFFLDSYKILRILNYINPDIIYQRGGTAYAGIGAYFAKKRDCKMIIHIASRSLCTSYKIKKRDILHPFDYVNAKFHEYGIRKSDFIITQANYQNELLMKNFGRESDFTVPNFHLKPKFAIKKRSPVKIVFIANFKKLKCPEIFIKIAKELINYENVKFIMIGKSTKAYWQDKLKNEINKLDNLEYIGEQPIEIVNEILCQSHLFINTSLNKEGFPNTFIQAWMRKVPVISLNVDPDNVIKKEKIGFHSRNFEQLIKDVKTLITNKKLREEMGQRAQKYAYKNHSMDNIKKIVKLIEGK